MKILHVVNSLEPGGMEGVLVRVAAEMDARGNEVHVCCLGEPGMLAERMPEGRVHALRKAPGFKIGVIFQLRRLIAKLKPDVLHTHNLGPLIYGVPATFWGRSVSILHGEHAQLAPAELRPKRLRIRRALYRACKLVHTVSAGQLDELRALPLTNDANKLVAIVNGVDSERYRPESADAARGTLGIPTEPTLLGIVGRFRPSKRHVALIEAMAKLSDNIHLAVIGDGPEADAIHAAVEAAGCEARIHFVGHLKDPRPAYHAMDLLVIPSVSEGLSNVLLEAMACGVPAVANNACGNGETITDNVDGWLRPMPDAESIATHLNEIVGDMETIRSVGVVARKTVQEKFDFQRTINEYEKTYGAVVS